MAAVVRNISTDRTMVAGKFWTIDETSTFILRNLKVALRSSKSQSKIAVGRPLARSALQIDAGTRMCPSRTDATAIGRIERRRVPLNFEHAHSVLSSLCVCTFPKAEQNTNFRRLNRSASNQKFPSFFFFFSTPRRPNKNERILCLSVV